ncbi:MAG: Arc family DNA-binding protein [Gammaproteobacteria bacterium]|nr:Arc family DNA-binding protein [Gammaproteobacteria bacterium]
MDVAEQSQRFVLRLPPALHRRVTEAAAVYRRSMNAEIVARLEYSLSGIPADADVSAVEPALFPYLETTFRGELSDEENRLIRLFRRLSASQRAALVDLLGG